MKAGKSVRKVIAAVAAVALVFGLVPASAFAVAGDAAGAGDSRGTAQRSEAEIDAAVESMLAAGDYVEGKAVVCVLGASAAENGISTQSDDDANGLLDGAEQLSSVTAGQYFEATGQAAPDVATSAGALSVQSESAGDAVSIALVERDDMSTEQLLRQLLADPRVLSAEPDYLMSFDDDSADDSATSGDQAADPSQPADAADGSSTQPSGETTFDMTSYQWFSKGAAASVPQYLSNVPNPGISVPNWGATGSKNASGVVAIMDSGVDHKHPDLKNVMYHFTKDQQEALGCGEYGYAPSRTDHTNTMDYLHHGTHCAGIVAAEWNGFGVSGVANGVEICAVSIAESETSSSFSYDGIVKGFDFLVRAAKAGVDIRSVNCSFDSSPTNNAANAIIQAAGEAGIVTCYASGNDGKDLETHYNDIATKQQSPYILRVNASRPQDDRAWFSNYGAYLTDVFSPGSAILSTIPTNVDSSWRYFPQADASPLYRETKFEDDSKLPRVWLGAKENDDPETRLEVSKANDVGVDGDSASAKFTAGLQATNMNTLFIDVPVGEIDHEDIQDVSFALYCDSFSITQLRASIQLANGSADESYLDGDASRSDNSLFGWLMCGLHVSNPTTFKTYSEDGQTYVRLRVDAMFNDSNMEDFAKRDVDMRIDQIAIGKRDNGAYLPYCYLNGTSMATPAVTGSAAIVSSRIQDATPNVTPGERAAQTVRTLKAAVHQASGYSNLCKQGGQIDLGILGQTDKYVPVLESAEVADGAITLKGAYFGSQAGTLTVGDVAASPSSWSSDEIVAPWPAGATSGLAPLSVKTNAGQTTRAFLLSAPAGNSASVDLFETNLAVPNVRADGSSTTACPYSIVADGDGTLFAAAGSLDDQMEETTGYLFRSDDAGASWTKLALPQPLKRVSLAAGDGVVYVIGATPAGSLQSAIEAWHLYSLDTAKNEFAHLHDYSTDSSKDEMKTSVSLAYAAGNLYVVDCRTENSESESGSDSGSDSSSDSGSSSDSSSDSNSDSGSGTDPGASSGSASSFAAAAESGSDSDGAVAEKPSHMRVRKLDASYQLGDGFTLKHDYLSGGSYYAPKVSVAGNSIYVCDLQADSGTKKTAYGLERVDVAANGDLSSTDLSAALSALGKDVAVENVCIAAADDGVYLVGQGLENLLPSGAKHADTFFLKKGKASFEAYSKVLSLSPVFTPAATCANGRLCAFATSEYEGTPVFGRATELPQTPEPDPTPTPTPSPAPAQQPKKGDVIVKGSYSYTVLSSTEVSVKLAASKKKTIVKATVPAKVTLKGKSFKVTKVQAKGFASAKKLKSVVLGANVKTIGAKAFWNCKQLKSFKATSKNLAKVGASAFKACKKLAKLTMAKTTKLTKAGVKKSLAGSSVKTVDVKNSKKAAYKVCFTAKNCGKKVTLK